MKNNSREFHFSSLFEVVYSFSENGIDQTTSNETCSTSMLIIKRIRKTVRARNIQNGFEKWIFR